MRRILALSWLLALAMGLVLPTSSAPVLASSATSTTYVFGGCFTDFSDVAFWDVGKDGKIEYTTATIQQDSYFYLDGHWQLVGTEIDRVMDVTNYAQGNEIFRGTFNLHSTVIGDFAGSFVWLENASGIGGPSIGRATDGSGRLWKATLGIVDPASYLPLPDCMTGGEPVTLNLAQIVTP